LSHTHEHAVAIAVAMQTIPEDRSDDAE